MNKSTSWFTMNQIWLILTVTFVYKWSFQYLHLTFPVKLLKDPCQPIKDSVWSPRNDEQHWARILSMIFGVIEVCYYYILKGAAQLGNNKLMDTEGFNYRVKQQRSNRKLNWCQNSHTEGTFSSTNSTIYNCCTSKKLKGSCWSHSMGWLKHIKYY